MTLFIGPRASAMDIRLYIGLYPRGGMDVVRGGR